MPSSRSERIIPFDSIPRSLAFFSFSPPGMRAPGVTTATVCPAATFGAPQTIVRVPLPSSTSQTRRRSAFGCCSALSTRPTTNPSALGAPRCEIRSSSIECIDSVEPISSALSPGSQYSVSQEYGTFI